MHESESEVAQPCTTPSDHLDCSPPGSSVHGIFQARVLEWVAIAFSEETPRILKLIESERTRIDAGGWGRENGELVFNRIRGSVGR